MKCPACDRKLSEVKVGSVAVDICEGGCGGIWFDALELKKVSQEHESRAGTVVNIHRDAKIMVDDQQPRVCPRCAEVKLERRIPRLGSVVEIDLCPRCGGYWLDHGELEKIIEENRHFSGVKPVKRIFVNVEVINYVNNLQIKKYPRP
jgi:Zn-finger nucleic acid-binding protein